MPAPDLVSLYQFEAQLETAAVAVVSTGLSGVQVVPERTTLALSTPRIEAKLHLGVPTGHRRPLVGALYSPSQTIADRFHGQLVLTTITNRKGGAANAGRHDELVARVRTTMLLALGGLNAQLAWLTVMSIESMGVIPLAQGATDLDQNPEAFALQFWIKDGAWPVLPPAA